MLAQPIHGQAADGAHINLAVDDRGHGEFYGGPRRLAADGAAVELMRQVRGVVGIENRLAIHHLGSARVQRPHNGITDAVGGDAGRGAGEANAVGGLRDGAAGKQAIGEGKLLERVIDPVEVNIPVEIRGRAKDGGDDGGQRLNDLGVAAALEVPQIVAIHDVEAPFLAALNREVRVRSGLVGQQENSTAPWSLSLTSRVAWSNGVK